MTRFVCPVCSGNLVSHFSQHGSYWFCNHCHEEMPALIRLSETEIILQVGSTCNIDKVSNQPFLIEEYSSSTTEAAIAEAK